MRLSRRTPRIADVGVPGEYPYTRGIHPAGYRGKLWTMRQFAGFGTAADTNRRFKYLLDHGQTDLSGAFDLPSLYGYDSDSPMSAGEVCKWWVTGTLQNDILKEYIAQKEYIYPGGVDGAPGAGLHPPRRDGVRPTTSSAQP